MIEISYDYRCPFAYALHECVYAALDRGARWSFKFTPFLLNARFEPDLDVLFTAERHRPARRAHEVGIAVRELSPDRFDAVHLELFRAFHSRGQSLYREATLCGVLESCGLTPEPVFEFLASGIANSLVRASHRRLAEQGILGVPTVTTERGSALVRYLAEQGDPISRIDAVLRAVDDAGFGNTVGPLTVPVPRAAAREKAGSR